MRTVTAKVNAYVTNQFTTIDELYKGEPTDVVGALKFYYKEDKRNVPDCWVLAGSAEVTLTLNDPDDLIAHKVDSIKAELNKEIADSHRKQTMLREQIQSLLAISYKPEVEA